jgi:hypothetical protein
MSTNKYPPQGDFGHLHSSAGCRYNAARGAPVLLVAGRPRPPLGPDWITCVAALLRLRREHGGADGGRPAAGCGGGLCQRAAAAALHAPAGGAPCAP